MRFVQLVPAVAVLDLEDPEIGVVFPLAGDQLVGRALLDGRFPRPSGPDEIAVEVETAVEDGRGAVEMIDLQ